MEKGEAPAQPSSPDWKPLFAAAGLDVSTLQPAPSVWAPLAAADLRQAWDGEWPGYKHRPLHVEAAAWHGRPVYFSLTGPWTRPARMPSNEAGGTSAVITRIGLVLILLVPVFTAVFLARWNFVRGRGDRRGAMRLAIAIFALHLVVWLFQSHFSSVGNSLYLLFLAIATALLWGGAIWTLYLAIEPYVRRYWPQAIISWTRALSGSWRDPLVGRDVLLGVILGTVFCDLYALRFYLEARLGAPPLSGADAFLESGRIALSAWLVLIPGSVASTLLLFLILFLCRALLRNSWFAAAGFVLLFTAMKAVSSNYPGVEWPMQAILYAVLAAGALRYGLVTLVVALYTADLALNIPISLNPSAWYFTTGMLALASIAALAIWGFYTALAGQTPWKTDS
jgi:serine/threonine-protein kinase